MTAIKKPAFISFEPKDSSFLAFLSMEGFFEYRENAERGLQKAAFIYEKHICTMLGIIDEMKSIRKSGRLTPARKIWELGDVIFNLTEQMAKLSFQIDGLYEHLVRDLRVKRKWLEKVVIFRRYLPIKKIIPPSLNWGKCEKGTRKAAEKLLQEFSSKKNETKRYNPK